MSKKTKIWLMIGASLIVLGGILFTGVMTVMGWNFRKLSTDKMVTNEYTVSETYQNISVDAITADVTFILTDGETKVTCYEKEKVRHTVKVEDGTLVIRGVDQRKWYDYIGFHFEAPKITVSLPRGEYGNLTLRDTTGDVKLPQGIAFANAEVSVTTGDVFFAASATGNVQLKTTTGDMYLKGVRCGDLTAEGTTGDVEMKDVIATGKITVKVTTGDVELEGCDGGELFLKATTGDVEGTLLTPKTFEAKATTGHVKVPRTDSGGLCKIKTTTGDIDIDIR